MTWCAIQPSSSMRGEMFTRGSKGGPSSSDNLPISVSSQKRLAGRAAPSIISNDLVIIGTLTSTGEIQIDGRVDGDIRSGSVTIGEKANFEGEIVAEECTIRGRVQGTVRARKVHLLSTCHMEGTILHEALSVEVGAFFEGSCRHCADPLAEVAGKPEPRPTFEPKRELGIVASNPPPQSAPAPSPVGVGRTAANARTQSSTGSLLGAIKSGR